jgi:hypothetical protein
VRNFHALLQLLDQKRLDIEPIRHIKAAARLLLTLHGGSGTQDDDLRNAIVAGINAAVESVKKVVSSRLQLFREWLTPVNSESFVIGLDLHEVECLLWPNVVIASLSAGQSDTINWAVGRSARKTFRWYVIHTGMRGSGLEA